MSEILGSIWWLLVALGLIAILGRPASVTAAIEKHQHTHGAVPDPGKAGETCCDSEEKAPEASP